MTAVAESTALVWRRVRLSGVEREDRVGSPVAGKLAYWVVRGGHALCGKLVASRLVDFSGGHTYAA